MYWDFHFSGIIMTLIGMIMLNWFNSKSNVDVGNDICTKIIFPVNYNGIKYRLKYWRPYPMISHVIPRMDSSSFMSGCISRPLMDFL